MERLGPASVRRALQRVPRAAFLPPAQQEYAHLDTALPIACGQTISQPSLVARMTELLELTPGDKVLEIGTGSGYQTAVLAALGEVAVYSVEIIPELALAAAGRLSALGLDQVQFKVGDGYAGWPEHAPYAAILVTAAPEQVPPPLIAQLAEGGRLVLPVGPAEGRQKLQRLTRRGAQVETQILFDVAFVPLTRRPGS